MPAPTRLLIGDAAHAIVPFHGQGMNCAFEDCAVLDTLLEQETGDWGEVFQRFSAARKPDADAIAEMALENYVEMRDTVRDPKFHLRKALAWELEARLPAYFVPRYSMVMFRRIPYAQARARGALQAKTSRIADPRRQHAGRRRHGTGRAHGERDADAH